MDEELRQGCEDDARADTASAGVITLAIYAGCNLLPMKPGSSRNLPRTSRFGLKYRPLDKSQEEDEEDEVGPKTGFRNARKTSFNCICTTIAKCVLT